MASSTPQLLEHSSLSLPFTPFDVKWVPMSSKLLTVGCLPRGDGSLQVVDFDEGQKLKSVAKMERKEGMKCATFGASSYEKRQIAVGGYNGSLDVFDVSTLSPSSPPLFHVAAHSSIVNTIDGCGGLNVGYGAPELVTGGRDGKVRVWDIRVSDPVASLEPVDGKTPRDCWAVAFGNSFNDSDRMVTAAFDNGDVKLFDLRQNRLIWEVNVNNGVASIQFDRKDIEMNKLVITTLEAKLRVYDMRTKHEEEGYAYVGESAHKSTVWCGRHCPHNRDLFVTTGGNGTVNLYKYNYPEQRSVKDKEGKERGVSGSLSLLNTAKMSDQPIVTFDWCNDKMGLAALAALDQTLKVVLITKLNTF